MARTGLDRGGRRIPETAKSELQIGVRNRRRIPSKDGSAVSASSKPRRTPASVGKLALSADLRNAWLGREDSNLRMAESKSAALPLGDAPTALALRPRAADHNRRSVAPQRFSARQNALCGEARGGRKARAPALIVVTALPAKAVARMRQAE